jgi:ATP dependent DNA ligase domain
MAGFMRLKHDGFRIVALKDGESVRLWSRNGRDWSVEFVAISAASMALPFARIVLDGEAVALCPGGGLPDAVGARTDQKKESRSSRGGFPRLRLGAPFVLASQKPPRAPAVAGKLEGALPRDRALYLKVYSRSLPRVTLMGSASDSEEHIVSWIQTWAA